LRLSNLIAPATILCVLPAAFIFAATAKSKPKSTAATNSSKTKSSKTKASRRSSKRRQQAWRSRQLEPTPERYREIQQALSARGYLKEEPSGKWDQASVEALRRFQQDQNLEPSGKVDALSLIALGLGPKYESSAETRSPAVKAQP